MAKRQFTLMPEETLKLRVAYDNCTDVALSKKLLAIRLYGNNRQVAEILDLVGCSRSSLMNWIRQYRQQGIESLKDQRLGGNHYLLNSKQKATLKEQLHHYSPKELLGSDHATSCGTFWTAADLKILIFKKFDVIYKTRVSYWLLLTEFGLTYQRTERIFKSRSALKVADFEEQLEKN